MLARHPDEVEGYAGFYTAANMMANSKNDATAEQIRRSWAVDLSWGPLDDFLHRRRGTRRGMVRYTNRWVRFVSLFAMILACTVSTGQATVATFEVRGGSSGR